MEKTTLKIHEQIIKLLDNRHGDTVYSKYVEDELNKKYETNTGSVLVSDRCYNRYNKYHKKNFQNQIHLFEYIKQGEYKYLGVKYNFTGKVVHNPKSKDEDATIVGEWKNGKLKMFDNIENEEDINEVINLIEGAEKTVLVKKYERSLKARKYAIKYHGLNCKVCEMNFEDEYGKIGKEFIHIHHIVPIHKKSKNLKINYKTDLIPVCPNCHSMLHRKMNGVEPTVDELKKLFEK